jgi:2-desacetyl-2-hydroxyethyl bacteriochlorophyllide A dehydrogenase
VLIDVEAVGICGTDYHIYAGNQPFLEYPRVIGHELSGRVVRDAAGWPAGRLVVVNPYVACGTCHACRKGKPNCCMRIGVLGVHRDGGLCGRIAVPAGNLYDAGDLGPLAAAMVEFLAIGAHAVRRAELAPGDRVLVTGAGPIGLGVALFARLAGAEVHLCDAAPARLETIGRLFGFDRLHAPGPDLLAGERADGFDAVFDATGSRAAIEAGFAHVAHGGTYVLVSVVKGEIAFVDSEFHKREMRLLASRNAVEADFRAVMDAFAARHVEAGRIASLVLPLAEIAARMPALAQDRDAVVKVVVDVSGTAAGAPHDR